jgi:hypothetical protein
MKKLFVSLALLFSVAGPGAYAAKDDPVTKEILASFKKEFPGINAITWAEINGYVRATFMLGGQRTEAYFSDDGYFHGSVRHLFFNQLPLAAMKAVDMDYPNAAIAEVYEITNAEGTRYRVQLEYNGKKYRIKVNANGEISETEKIKK